MSKDKDIDSSAVASYWLLQKLASEKTGLEVDTVQFGVAWVERLWVTVRHTWPLIWWPLSCTTTFSIKCHIIYDLP